MDGKADAVQEEELVIEFLIDEDGNLGYPDCSYIHMAVLGLIDPELVELNRELNGPDWDGMGICG